MSAITMSGGSIPSVVTKRWSGRSASSLPRMNRSTPHNRIVAMPRRDDSTVDTDYKHGLELARSGEFFAAHEAFETAWRAAAPGGRDPREDERCAEPERVREQEDDAAHDRPAGAGEHEDRGQHGADARCRADREGAAEERRRAAPARTQEQPRCDGPLRPRQQADER